MSNYAGRHEFKYLLTNNKAKEIIAFVERIKLKKDKSQGGDYYVTSLYFDTPNLSDYYDKLGGFLQRQKLRARIYQRSLDDAEKVNLEIKLKKDTKTRKKKIQFTNKEWSDFSKNFSLRDLANKETLKNSDFIDFFNGKCYNPTVVVRYKRRVYVDKFLSDLRLTFDSNIETGWASDLDCRLKMTPVYKNHTVMEIKFNEAMPWWFKEMLYRFELNRQVFSKYTNSLDALTKLHPMPR